MRPRKRSHRSNAKYVRTRFDVRTLLFQSFDRCGQEKGRIDQMRSTSEPGSTLDDAVRTSVRPSVRPSVRQSVRPCVRTLDNAVPSLKKENTNKKSKIAKRFDFFCFRRPRLAGSIVRLAHVPSALHPRPPRCIRALICNPGIIFAAPRAV